MGFDTLWPKWYPQGTPREIAIEEITMCEALERTASKVPDKQAFVYMGKVISYGQLNRMVNRFANALIDLGVKPGDKLAMILPNLPQVIIVNYAAYKVGAVTAMNNPLYTERELAYQLNDSDAVLAVTLDLLLPRILKIQNETKTEIKIVDLDTGKPIDKPNQEGEICVRGPQVMKGYYKKTEETAAAVKNGWFYLGDIGFFDEDGYLTIVDRKKDMIIASGYNVYPKEIDEILMNHPAVLEACAVGISDPYRGETVKAFVVLNPGMAATEEEIAGHCKKNLAPYKVPKLFEFIDELPKSAVGKILRRELKRREQEKPILSD